MNGILVLEDGTFFRGELISASDACEGEVVFNTSQTGYQEILTDPSYSGQIVTLTSAHIGNYGTNINDTESGFIHAAGLLMRDYHSPPSNWRSDLNLDAYLDKSHTTAMCGVDTRALVLHIRSVGALRGVVRRLPNECSGLPLVGKECDAPLAIKQMCELAQKVPSMKGLDLASRITCKQQITIGPKSASYHIVVLDFGVKASIISQLKNLGCRITIVPSSTDDETIMRLKPDGVLLSNGPGDPAPLTDAVETIWRLLGNVPIFGICLGHQLLSRACGGATYKLPFGHRGANHPVKDLKTNRIEITSQNHGFAVQASSLDGHLVEITHINLNDGTVEGLRHRIFPAFSVQFHPEASPGPHDSHHLFSKFIGLIEQTNLIFSD